jgi:hypothetical protein
VYRHSLIGIGLAVLLLVGFSTTGRAHIMDSVHLEE